MHIIKCTVIARSPALRGKLRDEAILCYSLETALKSAVVPLLPCQFVHSEWLAGNLLNNGMKLKYSE